MAAAIEVSGVSKSFRIPHEQRTYLKEYFLHPFSRTTYERNEALKDVTFSVEAGEFFGVFGPNGSGKSTLLRILAGIYVPDTGLVRVSGLLSPFIELGVGFNLELNARDNIRINSTLAGLNKRQLDERFGFQEKCFTTFERFREDGKTIVLVTHQFDLLRRFCDRVLLLEKGVVRVVGSPGEVIEVPREGALVG